MCDKSEAGDVFRKDPDMNVHVGEVNLGKENRDKGGVHLEDVE